MLIKYVQSLTASVEQGYLVRIVMVFGGKIVKDITEKRNKGDVDCRMKANKQVAIYVNGSLSGHMTNEELEQKLSMYK